MATDLKVNVDTSEVDKAVEKVTRLCNLLQEAKDLLHELAALEINIDPVLRNDSKSNK